MITKIATETILVTEIANGNILVTKIADDTILVTKIAIGTVLVTKKAIETIEEQLIEVHRLFDNKFIDLISKTPLFNESAQTVKVKFNLNKTFRGNDKH